MNEIEEEKPAWWYEEEEEEEEEEYQKRHMLPDIIEIDETKSFTSSRDGANSVYIAVGKDDLDVVKWALNHTPTPCVFLIHVFPPVTYIPTPVGNMPRIQASQEQVNRFLREENTRRRNLLEKYVVVCNNAKVAVETLLIESNQTAKAILELLPVLNITRLVMGIKKPSSRLLRKGGSSSSEFVQKNAPDFCEVTIVYNGKKFAGQQVAASEKSQEQNTSQTEVIQQAERNFFECGCFNGKSS